MLKSKLNVLTLKKEPLPAVIFHEPEAIELCTTTPLMKTRTHSGCKGELPTFQELLSVTLPQQEGVNQQEVTRKRNAKGMCVGTGKAGSLAVVDMGLLFGHESVCFDCGSFVLQM
ncbi:hypothetical protein P7K49_013499 [Saguinus oedipus]|uniref:Uncharacterized protein n=1 Tax=Saguinus oedipus TaxID=9490 RepID=A0ABQ9VG50_SAGOE|nr:hypothetical protein P7K49_013499 [Saguinus oedipus]